MTPPRYPCGTIEQMADIPEEAMDRFLAELPHILQTIREIRAAAPTMGAEIKDKAPWPLSLLSASFHERMILSQVGKKMTWVDDDKGTGTISVSVAGEKPFYSRTEKIGGAA